MLERNEWKVISSNDDIHSDPVTAEISKRLGLHPVTARLLADRGHKTPESARNFLDKKTELLHDPFLMPDMAAAVEVIIKAVADGEKIAVFGDYDVDGVTSVCCLYTYLRDLGADAVYYIPRRTGEGYGMSSGAIHRLHGEGVKLIITVDTGITAVAEAELIKSLGMHLVITDHHECYGELPDCEAVVNPKRPDCDYPFCELAGVGVVFKLLCALTERREAISRTAAIRRTAENYADLVAIGTIADVMPITDENRLIVSFGFKLIEDSPRPGLLRLLYTTEPGRMRQKPKKVTSGIIGYTVAPRINAAGRMDSASVAVELFLAETAEQAAPLANQLCEINKKRQLEENKILSEAIAEIDREALSPDNPVLVLANEKWHHGIIGIVASRLTEKFGRPSILISFEDPTAGENADREPSPDDIGKGSGRSIKGMNLVDALGACSDLIEKYGGHELAAGLSIKRSELDEFRRRINGYAREKLADSPLGATFEADCELSEEDISLALAEELDCLEPYGVSNPQPLFASFNMEIADITAVGAGKHTRITLKCGRGEIVCMFFRRSIEEVDLYPGDRVNVLYNLDVNEFNGVTSPQMVVRDMHQAGEGAITAATVAKLRSVRAYINGEIDKKPTLDENIVPDRAELGIFFTAIKREILHSNNIFSLHALEILFADLGHTFSPLKLGMMVDVMNDLSLFRIEYSATLDEVYTFTPPIFEGKTSLDNSKFLAKLREEYPPR